MYNQKECLVFSIIYSELTEGRFKKPLIDHDILFHLFLETNNKNINIFNLEDPEIEKEIEQISTSFSLKYPRKKVATRKEKLKTLFLNKSRINELFNIAESEIKLCHKENIKIINFNDKKYPKSLKELSDPPFTLFVKGNLPSDEELEKSLAIIGSRKVEPKYSEKVAIKVAESLYDMGWWNISGLALGIDTYGHIGSLKKGGLTGAVLGYGLAQKIYPKENEKLAYEILEKNGFLLSEIHPSRKIEDIFLTQRNRLQSGLTRGIFVVATSKNSGTLHTVKHSLSQDSKLTYIWDPMNIKGHHDILELSGNISLLKTQNPKDFSSVKFNKKHFNNIQGIKKAEELEKELRKHRKIPKVENNKLW